MRKLLIGALLALTCCHPFEVAKRKYQTTVVDTVYTNIITTIPRDSAVLVLKTDTTRVHLVERIKQGRATVTIIREPTNTTVIANCDSVSKSQKVITQTVRQLWGVDPRYKDKANYYKTGFFSLLGIVLLSLLIVYLLSKFRLNVAKR